MTAWIHSRKGRIEGEVIREDDEWMWVRLNGEHQFTYFSEQHRGRIDFDGKILTLRRSLMREVLSDRDSTVCAELDAIDADEQKEANG